MPDTPKKDELPQNGFLAVLQRKETQVGALSEASRLLAEAVRAAAITGKKATVTLVLTVEPKLNALNFVTKLTSKVPQEEEPLCIFYCDTQGNLYRNDPRQQELALSAHDGGLSVTRETSEATAAQA